MATPYKDLTKPEKEALREQFWNAIQAGSVGGVSAVIDRGFPFKDSVNGGLLALADAARRGKVDIIRLLLDRGVKVNKRSGPESTTALLQAARFGKLDAVTLLLDRGADINQYDRGGRTALYHSVDQRHLEVTTLLVTRGADKEVGTEFRETPLLRAVSIFREGIDVLLNAGANPNVTNIAGLTPLHMMSNWGPAWFADIQKFVAKGANVNAKDSQGRSPLVMAILARWTEGVRYFLDNGADPNIVFTYKSTPYTTLGVAIDEQQKLIAETLIEKLADVNTKYGPSHLTALIHMAYLNWTDTVAKLIEKGADVNAQASNGVTALMEASVGGNNETIKLLLDRGANINATTNIRKRTSLYDAISEKNVETALLLIERGADVNLTLNNGMSPLMHAAELGFPEVVSALIAKGANVDAKEEQLGKTALMFAAANNDDITVGVLLIEGNAKKEIKDNEELIAADYTTDEELKKALFVDVPDVPWKGQTKEDIEIFDTFFEDVLNWSFCPICLGYTQRSEACRYMHHNCRDMRGSFPNTRLYNLYKTEEGNIYWCTICGRICKGHRHFPLTPHQAERAPGLVPLVPNADYFGADEQCIKDGGGGIPEKVKRFERLLAWTKELQSQVGEIGNREARAQIAEEAWNAPLLQMNTAAILAARKFTTSKDDFPSAAPSVVAEVAEGPLPDVQKPADEVALVPEVLETGFDAYEIEDVSPAIRFVHKGKDGNVFRHTDDQLVGKESLTKIIRQMAPNFASDDFGICFEPDCGAKLWPQDIEPFITDPEVFQQYKTSFNKKFAAKQGGSAGTVPIVYPITNESCTLKETIAPEPFTSGIIEAVRTGDVQYIQDFLEGGVDVEQPDSDGNTALMHAVILGTPMIVSILIAAGANPNAQNKQGVTPLKKAEELGDAAVIAILNPTPSGPVEVTPTETVPVANKVYDVSGQTEVPLDEFLMIHEQNAVIVFVGNKVLGFQRGDLTASGDNYSLGSVVVPATEMVPVLNSIHPYWKLEKSRMVPVTMASGGTRRKTYRKRKTSRKSKASGRA
jgi:ankyrin repeat protein